MAYFGFGLIVYAIFNFLYLTVLFQSAYQVGKAFVIAIIPATAVIALMEYSVHLPSFTWLDSLQTGDLTVSYTHLAIVFNHLCRGPLLTRDGSFDRGAVQQHFLFGHPLNTPVIVLL